MNILWQYVAMKQLRRENMWLRRFAVGYLLLAPSAVFSQSLPSDSAILQMLAVRVNSQRGATGVVIGIAEPQGHRIVAYGRRGLADRAAVDGNTVYDIGSVTKVFTALLLADMAQRGELVLDDPVRKCLPALTFPTFGGKEITLLDLATQTSGLPLRPNNLVSKDPENKYADYSRDDLAVFLASFKLTREPGSRYEYSNVGYGLLGIALSACAHGNYAGLVRARITGPLGMPDTRIDATDEMRRREAVGYDNNLKPVPHESEGVLVGAGSLRSTANALLNLLDAFLQLRNTPLSPAMKMMTATQRRGGMEPATAIALAWNVYRDGAHETIWKNGSVGGYRAFIGYDAQLRLGIVALANAQTGEGVDDIGLHLLDPAIRVDMHIPRAHHEIVLAPAILDQFTGVYRYSSTDVLTVTREGDRLFGAEPSQDKFELFSESPRDFFLKTVDAQVTFEAIQNGRADRAIWHQGGSDERGVRVK